MNKLNTNAFNESSSEPFEQQEEALTPNATSKKQFIEPVVSVPIDVLETTSFFQAATTVDTSDV